MVNQLVEEWLTNPVTVDGKTYGDPLCKFAIVRRGGRVHEIRQVVYDWSKGSVLFKLACPHRDAHNVRPVQESEVTSTNACHECWNIH